MRSYAKSIALYEKTRKHLAGGVSSNVRYASVPVPLFFARGEGARLYDVDGNVHIDYVLGNGPAILGHAPKKVVDAVAASLGEGQLFAAQNPRETELAERLCGLLPGAEVVRFSTSGTEAVLMAFRLARAFTGPYAPVLSASTLPVSQPLGVTIGGSRSVSGGATASLLVWPNEYGGRARQFRRARPAIGPAVEQAADTIVTAMGELAAEAIEESTRR